MLSLSYIEKRGSLGGSRLGEYAQDSDFTCGPPPSVCREVYCCAGKTSTVRAVFRDLQNQINRAAAALRRPKRIALDGKIGPATITAVGSEGTAALAVSQAPLDVVRQTITAPTVEGVSRYAFELRDFFKAVADLSGAPVSVSAPRAGTAFVFDETPVAPPAAAPAPDTAPATPAKKPIWPWILLGLGVVAGSGVLYYRATR